MSKFEKCPRCSSICPHKFSAVGELKIHETEKDRYEIESERNLSYAETNAIEKIRAAQNIQE